MLSVDDAEGVGILVDFGSDGGRLLVPRIEYREELNDGTPVYTGRQFPLVGGSFISFDRSQGLTLAKYNVRCIHGTRHPFRHGQVYTASSRGNSPRSAYYDNLDALFQNHAGVPCIRASADAIAFLEQVSPTGFKPSDLCAWATGVLTLHKRGDIDGLDAALVAARATQRDGAGMVAPGVDADAARRQAAAAAALAPPPALRRRRGTAVDASLTAAAVAAAAATAAAAARDARGAARQQAKGSVGGNDASSVVLPDDGIIDLS